MTPVGSWSPVSGPCRSIGIGRAQLRGRPARGPQRRVADPRASTRPASRTPWPARCTTSTRRQLLRRLDPRRWGRTSLFAAAAARLAVDDAGLDAAMLAAGPGRIVHRYDQRRVGGRRGADRRAASDGLRPAGPGTRSEQVPARRLAAAVNEELGLHRRGADARDRLLGQQLRHRLRVRRGPHRRGRLHGRRRRGLGRPLGARRVLPARRAGRDGVLALRPRPLRHPHRRGRRRRSLLETLDSRQARGARDLRRGARLRRQLRRQPHGRRRTRTSIAACMRLAHRNAGVDARGHRLHLRARHRHPGQRPRPRRGAVCEVFGERPPPISSIKSMIGHTMGAASGVRRDRAASRSTGSFLPPTINFERRRPGDRPGIDPVPEPGPPGAACGSRRTTASPSAATTPSSCWGGCS